MSGDAAIQKQEELFGLNFYVPEFEVYVGGHTWGAKDGRVLKGELKRDVVGVTYKDSVEDIDSFSLQVCNWDEEKRDFKYMDFKRSPFKIGEEIEIWMGYAGRLRPMIRGEITSLDASFPSSGAATLSVGGQNILRKLKKKQETHFYKNMTDAAIVQQIAGRLRVAKGMIKTGANYEIIKQDNRYDIVFLMELARKVGFEVTVENGRLDYKPSTNAGRKQYTLNWGQSLISFHPVLSTAKQVETVRVMGWDYRTKSPINETSKLKSLDAKGTGNPELNAIIDGSVAEREEVIVHKPVRSKQEGRVLAKAAHQRVAKDLITGEGMTIGLPDLRAGCRVELMNLGATFTGRYYLTASTHTIGEGGYTTQFNARKEEAGT